MLDNQRPDRKIAPIVTPNPSHLSPALTAAGTRLALNTPPIARVAAVSLGALALADDAVRVRGEVLAATGFEASADEGALMGCQWRLGR